MLTESQQNKFDRLSEILRRQNQIHNLTRITDPDEIRQRHFEDSLIAVEIINKLAQTENPKIIDIGSGAGFPGLALAIAMPNICFTSVDSTGKKINFQKLAADQLNIENINPLHARAEELSHDPGHREQYDFALSRAVADLAILAELAIPFIKPGGYFLAWKGQKARQEIDNSGNALKTLKAELIESIPYSFQKQTGESTLQILVIKKISSTPQNLPRKYKAIKQKPL